MLFKAKAFEHLIAARANFEVERVKKEKTSEMLFKAEAFEHLVAARANLGAE